MSGEGGLTFAGADMKDQRDGYQPNQRDGYQPNHLPSSPPYPPQLSTQTPTHHAITDFNGHQFTSLFGWLSTLLTYRSPFLFH